MNLWENEKELIELKKNSLTKDEKELVLDLFREVEYHRYLVLREERLRDRLAGKKIIPRGQA